MFGRLRDGARHHLDELHGGPADDSGGRWAPYQTMFFILGPMLHEPVLAPTLDRPVFDPDQLDERSKADQAVIARGILGAPSTADGSTDQHK